MKNKRIAMKVLGAILAGGIVLTLMSCSIGYISKSDAMNVAMEDLNLQQINVSNLTATLKKQNTPVAYKVVFIYATQTYEYLIDAKTKAIISKGIVAK
jgi:hypothetical protein